MSSVLLPWFRSFSCIILRTLDIKLSSNQRFRGNKETFTYVNIDDSKRITIFFRETASNTHSLLSFQNKARYSFYGTVTIFL